MIQVNELRHGSIIEFDDGSTDVVKVEYCFKTEGVWFVEWTKISGNGSLLTGNSILEDFEPMPLSPEILLACGFAKGIDDKWRTWDNEGFYLYKGTNAYYIPNIIPEVTSLHQLQNIFYFVTGKELIYKP